MDDGASPETCVRVIDDLFDEWAELMGEGEVRIRPRRTKTQPQTALVLAFALHVRATVAELRPKLPGDLTAVHYPLIRSVFETSLRTVWLDDDAAAADAMMNEEVRNRVNLRDTMLKAESMSDLADGVLYVNMERMDATLNPQARNFATMLGDDGAHLYAVYRMMSALSHPSVLLADQYLSAADDDGGPSFSLRAESDRAAGPAYAGILAVCLTRVTRVLMHYADDKAMRNRVRRYARELGVKGDVN